MKMNDFFIFHAKQVSANGQMKMLSFDSFL